MMCFTHNQTLLDIIVLGYFPLMDANIIGLDVIPRSHRLRYGKDLTNY